MKAYLKALVPATMFSTFIIVLVVMCMYLIHTTESLKQFLHWDGEMVEFPVAIITWVVLILLFALFFKSDFEEN